MSKKILMSILAIAIVVGLVGVGTYAMWSDSVVSDGNKFSTGSLALLVNGVHTNVAPLVFENQKPGDTHTFTFTAKNNGSIGGKLSVDAVFDGPMGHALVVGPVKVDGTDVLGGQQYFIDSVPGGILSIPAEALAAGIERPIEITITLPSSETGHMNETETGKLTFNLVQ